MNDQYSNTMACIYQIYSYLWIFPHSNIFGFSFVQILGIQLYSDIFSINLRHPNILGYLLGQFFGIWIYLDICLFNSWAIYLNIRSNKFYDICSSLRTTPPPTCGKSQTSIFIELRKVKKITGSSLILFQYKIPYKLIQKIFKWWSA